MCQQEIDDMLAGNILFSISVRSRPVQGVAGPAATHCYLALRKNDGSIFDTLSFDPSNSEGWRDGDPSDTSRGEVVVQANAPISAWFKVEKAFKRAAKRKPYVLANHNCCHAVMDALVATNLENANDGIHHARVANNTWATYVGGDASSADYIKKNV